MIRKLTYPALISILILAAFLTGLVAISSIEPARASMPLGDGVRASLSVTALANSSGLPLGISRSLAAVDGDGQKFVNNEDTFVEIASTYTGTITATFVTPATVGGLAVPDLEITLTENQVKIIGPFQSGIYNQTTGSDKGMIYINWNSEITGTFVNSVTIGAWKLR